MGSVDARKEAESPVSVLKQPLKHPPKMAEIYAEMTKII
jgi:hypothetical protein